MFFSNTNHESILATSRLIMAGIYHTKQQAIPGRPAAAERLTRCFVVSHTLFCSHKFQLVVNVWYRRWQTCHVCQILSKKRSFCWTQHNRHTIFRWRCNVVTDASNSILSSSAVSVCEMQSYVVISIQPNILLLTLLIHKQPPVCLLIDLSLKSLQDWMNT